jgi:excisionase family DNA binding protein
MVNAIKQISKIKTPHFNIKNNMNLSPEWVKAFAEQAELSAREAADLLNIPYAEIVKAIEAGEISHRKAGKSYKIKFNDLMAYKETIDRPKS